MVEPTSPRNPNFMSPKVRPLIQALETIAIDLEHEDPDTAALVTEALANFKAKPPKNEEDLYARLDDYEGVAELLEDMVDDDDLAEAAFEEPDDEDDEDDDEDEEPADSEDEDIDTKAFADDTDEDDAIEEEEEDDADDDELEGEWPGQNELEVPDFSVLAKGKKFKSALAALKEEIGVAAKEDVDLPGTYHFKVSREKGLDLDDLQSIAAKFASFIFETSHDVGPVSLVLIPSDDQFAALQVVQTAGPNFEIGPGHVFEWLRSLHHDYPLMITGANYNFVQGYFRDQPELDEALELAERIYEFCPDVVEQGTETVQALAQEIADQATFYLWWD